VLAGATASAPTTPTTPEPEVVPLERVATAFPQLEILELIGSGGMGAVYKARQPKLDRFVALKILSEDLAKDPAFAERFSREARTLARLSHPGIVAVYDFGHEGGLYYLMMEYVDGVNLRQAMAAGQFSASEALAIVPKICEALQFAHEAGVLHRDIKPENILLDERGRVKIADFGIAKMLGEKAGHATLTAQGSAVGTPHYMAPEQLETPKDIDERADIYSLGVVFYELLTGQLPLGRFALPSESAAVDPRVDPIVLRTLERDREKRHRTATEVRTKVEGIGTEPPPVGEPGMTPSGSPPVESTRVLPKAGPARTSGKAIAATVFSGIGLVVSSLWLVFTASIVTWIATGSSGGISVVGLLIITFVGLGCLGFLVAGLLFGTSAVHDLRGARGSLRGMGLAVFGVVAGPLLVLDVVLAVGLALVPMLLVGYLGILILALVVLPIVVAVDWLVVRRVWAWANGTHGGTAGQPSHGSRWASAIVALLVAAFLFLLLIPAIPLSYFTLSRKVSQADSPSLAPIVNTRAVEAVDETPWLERGPHLDLWVTLPPRQVATFSLMLSNTAGITPLNEYSAYVVASDREAFQGRLQWGWVEDEADSTAEPLLKLQARDLQGTTASTAGSLLKHQAFSALKQQRTLSLQAGKTEKVLMADPHPSPVSGEPVPQDSLWIEVVAAPRPPSTGDRTERSSALIGAGGIDWMTALEE
jgi:tRNA A-37 threonylcarbamoyl transferase component Bud32